MFRKLINNALHALYKNLFVQQKFEHTQKVVRQSVFFSYQQNKTGRYLYARFLIKANSKNSAKVFFIGQFVKLWKILRNI